jgi:hypothetical protein
MTRWLLLVACPLAAQLAPPVITQPHVVNIIVSVKPQCGWRNCSTAVVTIHNPSPYSITLSRTAILTDSAMLAIPHLTKEQAAASQSNGFFAVFGRVGMELGTLAPPTLSGIGLATRNASLGYWGIGGGFLMWLVQRAIARSQPVGTELPDGFDVGAGRGAEFVLHLQKLRKRDAKPVTFQLSVSTP